VPRSSAAALRKAGMTSSANRWRVRRSSVTTMKVPTPFKPPLGHVVSSLKAVGSRRDGGKLTQLDGPLMALNALTQNQR
jgi:hypothetical protein